VAPGPDAISSAEAMIDLDGSGVTWQFIPQSPAAGSVITRVSLNPDGTIDALVDDGAGGGMYVPTGANVPAGYFHLSAEVDASTFEFTIYIDGAAIFTGTGFAGEIEQVVLLSLMEVAGPTFDMDDFAINDGVIPVELTAFNAVANGSDVTLAWATASETNNAGFEVQMRQGGDWSPLGFVAGHGTTTEAQTYSYTAAGLDPGTYTFRLKQVDFDGAFEYSGEVEATVEVVGTHVLTQAYPNPFNPQASFALTASQSQRVVATLYAALGQRVAVLFDGSVEANVSQTVEIDGAGLASGLYVVRVEGERFADALRVTLLK